MSLTCEGCGKSPQTTNEVQNSCFYCERWPERKAHETQYTKEWRKGHKVQAYDGCLIGIDEVCSHGCVSPLLVLGLV